MEVLLLILSVFVISILLYIIRGHRKKDVDNMYLMLGVGGKRNNSSVPPPPAGYVSPRETLMTLSQYDFQSNQLETPITAWTKSQVSKYLDDTNRYKAVSANEAERIANLNPEEVVYLNDKQWFHPKACQHYPSKFSPGEELLVTLKGTWILKSPSFDDHTGYEYRKVTKKDAFIFLESNGFEDLAESLAPHKPSCEL